MNLIELKEMKAQYLKLNYDYTQPKKKSGELNNRSKEIVQNEVQGDNTIGSVKDLLRNIEYEMGKPTTCIMKVSEG